MSVRPSAVEIVMPLGFPPQGCTSGQGMVCECQTLQQTMHVAWRQAGSLLTSALVTVTQPLDFDEEISTEVPMVLVRCPVAS